MSTVPPTLPPEETGQRKPPEETGQRKPPEETGQRIPEETGQRKQRVSKWAWKPPPRRVKVSPAKLASVREALDLLGDPEPAEASPGAAASGGAVRRPRHANRGRPQPPPRIANGGPLASVRRQLPVAKHRAELLRALRRPVCLIQGETGSGKTTQIAQFLLEEAAALGRPIRVVCTQPRRISAIGVAERIAAERGEAVGKGAVGYAVRGEARQSPHNSLLVCTVGVLLRRLEEDPQLRAFDVVLVDEVHERSVENDLLLLALRRLLRRQEPPPRESPPPQKQPTERRGRGRQPRRRDGPPPLRIGLMSATADAELLSGCSAPSLLPMRQPSALRRPSSTSAPPLTSVPPGPPLTCLRRPPPVLLLLLLTPSPFPFQVL